MLNVCPYPLLGFNKIKIEEFSKSFFDENIIIIICAIYKCCTFVVHLYIALMMMFFSVFFFIFFKHSRSFHTQLFSQFPGNQKIVHSQILKMLINLNKLRTKEYGIVSIVQQFFFCVNCAVIPKLWVCLRSIPLARMDLFFS